MWLEILVSVDILISGFIAVYLVSIFRTKKPLENPCYTDYIYKDRILRVYKNEFEYQAIGSVLPTRILETGSLSQFYRWALIEDRR